MKRHRRLNSRLVAQRGRGEKEGGGGLILTATLMHTYPLGVVEGARKWILALPRHYVLRTIILSFRKHYLICSLLGINRFAILSGRVSGVRTRGTRSATVSCREGIALRNNYCVSTTTTARKTGGWKSRGRKVRAKADEERRGILTLGERMPPYSRRHKYSKKIECRRTGGKKKKKFPTLAGIKIQKLSFS